MGNETIDQAIGRLIQLYQQARLEEAEALCQQILTADPRRVEALNVAGLLAIARAEFEAAEQYFRQALAAAPESEYSWNNLGIALNNLSEFAKAAECFQKALAYNPNNPSALNNLGETLNNLCRHDEALACCMKALALVPDSVEVHQTLGVTYFCMARFQEALTHYRKALALDPMDARARTNYATTLLLLGDLLEGWKHYEFRLAYIPASFKTLPQVAPPWDGSPLEGRTLLVFAEQGLGDNIQFCRYLPMVRERGGKVIYMCRPELKQLCSSLEGVQLVGPDDPLPHVDAHCRIMSLPHLMATTMETIPQQVPYLRAEESKVRAWRERLPRGFKVGLVWAGNPKHTNDIRRSLTFPMIEPIVAVPGVTFVSVQKGYAAKQAYGRTGGIAWVDAEAELGDLSDTAALMANLDLVITVDTAMAHLAGALGRPVWTMLSYVPDFRWLMDRPDCPWYPTMRLMRQKAIDQWPEVIECVAAELRALVGK